MSLEFYRVVHFFGIFLVMAAIGAATGESVSRRAAAAGHGVGLLLVLVSGFGMLAKLGIGAPPAWAVVKIVIWLFLGGLLVLIRRDATVRRMAFVVAPVLGLLAAWSAAFKPI